MKNKYKTGYSSWGLIIKESEILISNIENSERFMLSEEQVDKSIIPVNSETSKRRIGLEIARRIRSLKKSVFIDLFKQGSDADKALILFYAACKSYQLIPDFMIDTVIRKWYNMDYELTSYDFKSFLHRKADQHPELSEISQKNISNLASSTIKMLNELGILKDGKLIKAELNNQILKEIANNGDSWLLEALLLNKSEREEIIGL